MRSVFLGFTRKTYALRLTEDPFQIACEEQITIVFKKILKGIKNAKKVLAAMILSSFIASHSQCEENSIFNKNIKVSKDSEGLVSLPINKGKYYFISNECKLVKSGVVQNLDTSIRYEPRPYGDIFYLQQYSGNPLPFVKDMLYLSLIERQCHNKEGEDIFTRTNLYKQYIQKTDVVDAILNIFDEYKNEVTYADLIQRIPQKGGAAACSNLMPTSHAERLALEDCLDMAAIAANVASMEERLQDASISLDVSYAAKSYEFRKKFSEYTAKVSYGYMSNAGAWTTNAYASIYFVSFFSVRENYAWADRISLDIGISKPNENASDKLKSADHYMIGLGYDLTETLSVSAAHIDSRYDDGSKEKDFAFSLSFDILNLIAN